MKPSYGVREEIDDRHKNCPLCCIQLCLTDAFMANLDAEQKPFSRSSFHKAGLAAASVTAFPRFSRRRRRE